MGSTKITHWGGIALLFTSLAIGCQTAKPMDAKSLCEALQKKGIVDNCRSADLAQNGVTRKEAMQFTVKFADEIAYGGQVMVFNAASDIDAYKAAADEKQKAYIKENKLEALADRQMPQHFENRDKLVLVTLLPGPAVGKVDVKLKEIPTIIAGK
jgi:hypothetical protein